MLTFDGWKNVAKQNILGITCITEKGEVIIYDARDISSEHSTMEATIKLVKDLLIEDGLKDDNIIAIVTDSSKRLEKRWRDWEQPLLLLAYFLNSDLRSSNLNLRACKISFVELCKYAQVYYKLWTGNKLQMLASEMAQYRDKTFPFDDYQVNQFKNKPLRFWKGST
ncbi:hypothetical protein C2G38_2160385 [Gigaspora rosea]|uniref:DUF659 domain-containing protein n=1 Tax=Gigaspora rosea TaxID=44941 RepID=A0A397VYC1_9GLOM|nr:hypothetical protein C2G38_2160385 [Gigaspora rosea]